jgi:nucleotide-binding universal stress UspA family protein
MLHPDEAAHAELEEWNDPDFEHAKRVTRSVIRGTPFVEIVRYAREQNVDLIVMGTHGRTGLEHALIGSVTEKVVRKAPCPVLTVRPEGHQFVMP